MRASVWIIGEGDGLERNRLSLGRVGDRSTWLLDPEGLTVSDLEAARLDADRQTMNPQDESEMFRATEQDFFERWTRLDLSFWLSLPLAILTVVVGTRFGVRHIESDWGAVLAAGAVGFVAFYPWRVVISRLLAGGRGRRVPK